MRARLVCIAAIAALLLSLQALAVRPHAKARAGESVAAEREVADEQAMNAAEAAIFEAAARGDAAELSSLLAQHVSAAGPTRGRQRVDLQKQRAIPKHLLVSCNALHAAATGGHLSAVRALVAAGAAIDAKAGDGATALGIAAHENHLEIVRVLGDAGADVSAARRGGLTPLMLAAERGHADVVRELVRRGARLEDVSEGGATALFIASYAARAGAVRELLRAGANASHAQPSSLAQPLHAAALANATSVVGLLLNRTTVDANAQMADGYTALHIAAEKGLAGIGRLLLACTRVNTSVPSVGNGLTALDLAIHHKQGTMVELLRAHSARGSLRDTYVQRSRAQQLVAIGAGTFCVFVAPLLACKLARRLHAP